MIGFSHTPAMTTALRQWRGRSLWPTEMSSAQLRSFSSQLRLRSVFSARMTNAEAVQGLADVIDGMLSGEFALGEGRYRMLRILKTLGYDPATGFPQDMAAIPPAEADSLQDLSSELRLNLMLETNFRVAANYGKLQAGNSDYALYWYPAWELVRIYERQVPRGTPESHSEGWQRRWQDAGESVDWEGAVGRRSEGGDRRSEGGQMIALKDSPIWSALGDGEGGYSDTLGNPFPPFAFNTGYGWRAVDRAECIGLGLIEGDERPQKTAASLAISEPALAKWYEGLAPDLREAFKKEIRSGLEVTA